MINKKSLNLKNSNTGNRFVSKAKLCSSKAHSQKKKTLQKPLLINPQFRSKNVKKITYKCNIAQTNQYSLDQQEILSDQQNQKYYNCRFNQHQFSKMFQSARDYAQKRKKWQKLKKISKYILLLIANNKHLNQKAISYLLYQIIAETDLGLQIQKQQFPEISQQAISELSKKYSNWNQFDHNLKLVIKNTKRRLYDVLNVMMSVNIIEEYAKTYQINYEHTYLLERVGCPMFSQFINQSVVHQRKLQISVQRKQQLRKNVVKKQKILQNLKKRQSYMKRLIQRNKKEKTHHKETVFNMPIAVIKCQPMTIWRQKGRLMIRSKRQISFIADLEVLSIVFQEIDTQSIENRVIC